MAMSAPLLWGAETAGGGSPYLSFRSPPAAIPGRKRTTSIDTSPRSVVVRWAQWGNPRRAVKSAHWRQLPMYLATSQITRHVGDPLRTVGAPGWRDTANAPSYLREVHRPAYVPP